MSKTPLRVLIVEDSEDDLVLLLDTLKRGGFDVTYRQVQSAEELKEALRAETWQIVISDYSLPGFDARAALEIVRPTTIPFFVLSGTIGETIAAEMMRAGAQDYIMKDNKTRLIPAIHRELEEFKYRESLRLSLQQKEDQLRQSQKMEAIGRLVGGIAHDFNNFLSVVMTLSESASEKIGKDHPAAKDLKGIYDASLRAAALTRQLLTFSRRQTTQPVPLNISATMAEMKDMLQRMVSSQIVFCCDLQWKIKPTLIDKSQFEQIVMNLVVNARDAMPEGGHITVKTANVLLDRAKTTPYSDIPPGEYVLLSLADSGVGMNPKALQHIFEPFFTTKGERGTGLGLATVYGIVQGANGYVDVRSVPQQGSVFDIYLPVCQAAEETKPTKAADTVAKVKKATLLIAEDQADLREAMAASLTSQNFEVFAAEGGQQAIALLEKNKEKIDLLITDMAMPELNGLQVIERALYIKPNLKIILMSGFFDQSIATLQNRRIEFLQKPFPNKILLERIAAVLGSTNAA